MKKGVLLIFCVTILVGCSQRLAYNNLGWLASYYISDFVDLTDQQEDQLESDVEALVNWHRQSELPKYQSQVQSLINNWQEMTEADVVAMFDTTRHYWYSVVAQVFPKLVHHLNTLNRQQKEMLITNLETQLLKDDWQDGDQYRRYERWLGKLNNAQRAIINEHYQQGEFARQVWRAHQQRRFNQFQQALMLSNDEHLSRGLFQKAIVTEPQQLPARIVEIQNRRIAATASLAIRLRATMSDKQEAHFEEELRDLLELLKSL
ncbi:DUF6279 family lipoprotein [Pseudoalteromonas peptidolytica]|uniref:Lipoprotein n=1 Tax=Pseudoalteromonas peptidolytica F12-50-A1 TaxID=1315280 RepID=A0A8I0T613_9GAMM|nr:DUF6279 family lipoprotein [Pseudoalteromonas peptidolytica]MBE0348615.1 hypothetical protein [Pseudoalteromonas peptidolytica F12-50-A1]NLR15763.1 hypothetical protein [Pseudoalteromonas peptidolytica]GEK11270.1 lipoprotein [Pseudoalteromonas peptidolytica]